MAASTETTHPSAPGADGSPVEALYDAAAAGTPGLAAPGHDQHGFVAHSHGNAPDDPIPVQSRAGRPKSFDVADFVVPSGREEDWRFTPLDRLRGLHSGAAESGEQPDVRIDAADGVLTELVDRHDPRLGRVGVPEDRVAAQAWSSFRTALVVTLPPELVADKPTTVTVDGRGGVGYTHVAVVAGRHSEGVVVLDHRGSAALAANVEVDVADGASLTLVSIQDWADDAVHLSAQRATLGRDSRLRHVVVTLGGDVVRITPTATFTAPGGEVELVGLYFADAGQHLEHRLFVDHAVPHCRSNVTYKGALQGDSAHTVWIGDVLIRAAAEGTETFELNRNLVLTEGARADSVPNLEIETGEIVGAGHASATGRFDDEQLFYLQARGIPQAQARRLVVRGFFNELIQKVGVPQLEARLVAAVEAELERSMGSPAGVGGPEVDG